jgi:hypothetical protein
MGCATLACIRNTSSIFWRAKGFKINCVNLPRGNGAIPLIFLHSSFFILLSWTLPAHCSFEMGWTLSAHFPFEMPADWTLSAHFSFEMGWN